VGLLELQWKNAQTLLGLRQALTTFGINNFFAAVIIVQSMLAQVIPSAGRNLAYVPAFPE
jgi:hypothetical protein